MTSCYTHIWVHSSTIIRKASSSSTWQLAQNQQLQRIGDFGIFSPKWDLFITTLPSRLRYICRREHEQIWRARGVDERQGNDISFAQQIHIKKHKDCNMSMACKTKVSQNPRIEEGYTFPSLDRVLSPLDFCWVRDNHLSSIKWH